MCTEFEVFMATLTHVTSYDVTETLVVNRQHTCCTACVADYTHFNPPALSVIIIDYDYDYCML